MDTKHLVLPRINIGDVVSRTACNLDKYYRVMNIYQGDDGKEYALLKGLSIRLAAEVPVEELMRVESDVVAEFKQQCQTENQDKITNLLRKRDEERVYYIKRAVGDQGVKQD